MRQINVILFDQVTTMDALGPAEVFSSLPDLYRLHYISQHGGPITTSTGNQILTKKFSSISLSDIMLIPGGWATRELVKDTTFITSLKELASISEYVLSVCTGSALLSKTGLLDGKLATSNKRAWDWVVEQNTHVNWIKSARWTVDGKYYTSSGITAGIDMSLGFIRDVIDEATALNIANSLEYRWNSDKDFDPFSS